MQAVEKNRRSVPTGYIILITKDGKKTSLGDRLVLTQAVSYAQVLKNHMNGRAIN